jgi:hypothetical protein
LPTGISSLLRATSDSGSLADSTYEGLWIYALPYWTELEREQ